MKRCRIGGRTGASDFLERLLEVAADDEDELAEPGAQRVVNRVVNDGFAGGADRINLFESAVSAAHAGGENEKCGFGHF